MLALRRGEPRGNSSGDAGVLGRIAAVAYAEAPLVLKLTGPALHLGLDSSAWNRDPTMSTQTTVW